MNADDFEWDDAKAAANLAKHGVTFEQARDAFNDPFAVDFVDDRADYRRAPPDPSWHGGEPPTDRRAHVERRESANYLRT